MTVWSMEHVFDRKACRGIHSLPKMPRVVVDWFNMNLLECPPFTTKCRASTYLRAVLMTVLFDRCFFVFAFFLIFCHHFGAFIFKFSFVLLLFRYLFYLKI